MAKANLKLPNGTEVNIEGTPEEITKLLEVYSEGASRASAKPRKARRASNSNKVGGKKSIRKSGPADLIRELIQEGYFKGQKRSLPDLQKKLEERGHIYAQSSLSSPLTRLTRSKDLRRLKEKKGWMYVV